MINKILEHFDPEQFQTDLITWYETNKRDLPWRKTEDPYAIWVSEIMLQQTQVDTVIGYYENFMNKYPTVFHLAQAAEQDVLKQWEGLGYYSRARNLHDAVKEVVSSYNGVVPTDKEQLSKLKGIGPYTLGAIMSIAYGKPEPAVDGNVMRVISRVLLIKENISEQKTRRLFEEIIRTIISYEDPSSFNQGLMEIGALVCSPKSPKCNVCPLQKHCRAFHNNMQQRLPVKQKQKRPKTKKYITLIVRDEQGRIAIEQRPNEGLLANMWQFPMIYYEKSLNIDDIISEIKNTYHVDVTLLTKIGNLKHIFSHLIWQMDIFKTEITSDYTHESSLKFVAEEELNNYPFSVAHIKIKQMFQEE